jgi:hypothetical protein
MNGRANSGRVTASLQSRILAAICRAAAAGVLFAGTLQLHGQAYLRPYPQEPRWATLNIDHVYTGIYAEAYTQSTSVAGGGDSTENRVFFGPLLGLNLSGSIYHPNLVAYHINVDGSLGWTDETYSGTAKGSSREVRFLGSFLGELGILDSKPLNGRLFSSYTHSYQDYDFFNRIYVDTWRYGGSLNYSTGPWRFFTTVTHETQDASGNPIPVWSETTFASAAVTHRFQRRHRRAGLQPEPFRHGRFWRAQALALGAQRRLQPARKRDDAHGPLQRHGWPPRDAQRTVEQPIQPQLCPEHLRRRGKRQPQRQRNAGTQTLPEPHHRPQCAGLPLHRDQRHG